MLVTGGPGFIGSFLTEDVLERGANVVVADNFSRGDFEKISHLKEEIEIKPVDLTTHKGYIDATEVLILCST